VAKIGEKLWKTELAPPVLFSRNGVLDQCRDFRNEISDRSQNPCYPGYFPTSLVNAGNLLWINRSETLIWNSIVW